MTDHADRRRQILHRVRQAGEAELAAHLEKDWAEIDSGITTAKWLWYAMSQEQRTMLQVLRERGSVPFTPTPTLAVLKQHNLVEIDGGRTRLTERGLFVLVHGEVRP